MSKTYFTYCPLCDYKLEPNTTAKPCNNPHKCTLGTKNINWISFYRRRYDSEGKFNPDNLKGTGLSEISNE